MAQRVGKVAICGGGVAALEALLALRQLLGGELEVDLIAPNSHFIYRAMAVAELFGLARTQQFGIAQIAAELDARLHVASLAAVEPERHELILDDGERLRYEVAIVAVGARPRDWLESACSFGPGASMRSSQEALRRLERGESSTVTFVSAPHTSWTLPIYELSLLMSSHLAERGVIGAELTVITHEASPLEIFGPGAAEMLRGQLADRGIRLRVGATVERFAGGEVLLSSGEALRSDEVIALADVEGPRLAGLPCDEGGFIVIDDQCAVRGIPEVYAAGDATSSPIKQGGMAAHQADVAVCSIAGERATQPLGGAAPVLRAVLLNGIAPIYLRRQMILEDPGTLELEIAGSPLWSPAIKVAARYLAPYLAGVSAGASLEDRSPAQGAEDTASRTRALVRDQAIAFADADARSGDFGSALSWLAIVERLEGALSERCLQRRLAWQSRVPSARTDTEAARSCQ